MKIRHFLMTLLALGTLCSGCVDPDFNLDDIKISSVAFQDLEVPIGNFEEITLNTILKAPGAAVLPLVPGTYALSGSAEITGISLQFDDQVYFKEAELHTVVVNTLPLDMNFSVLALDAEGQPCQDVTVSVKADKNPMIASGLPTKPSENPMVFMFKCQDRYMTLEALRLSFTGRTGAGFEDHAPEGNQGITLTKVSLKMPEGLYLNL